MQQYPVEIPYSFSVDLNIKEQHIPFVQVSILTDNVEEEIIEFAPNTKSFNYRDTFYVYGDTTLLYFGDPIQRIFRYYPTENLQWLGGWIREKWRAKYLVPEIWYGYNFVNWYEVEDDTDTEPRLGWTTHPFISAEGFKLKMPPLGTYSEIIVKRNTGLTTVIASGSAGTIFGNVLTHVTTPSVFVDVTVGQFLRIISGTDVIPGYYKIIAVADDKDSITLDSNPGNNDIGDVVYDISDSYSIAQGVNTDYDVPDYYTFPNLTRCEYQFSSNGYAGERYAGWEHIFESANVPHYTYSSGNPTREIYVPRPTENINMSKMWLQIGIGRYRLKVYGKFYKWTNQQIKSTITYPIGTYTFVANEEEDRYDFDSKLESTGTLNLYEPEPNPCNVRLLVSYLNNSGQNEIREYSL